MYFFGATNVYLVNKIQSDNARKKCNGFDFKSPASPLRVFAARVVPMFPVVQS